MVGANSPHFTMDLLLGQFALKTIGFCEISMVKNCIKLLGEMIKILDDQRD